MFLKMELTSESVLMSRDLRTSIWLHQYNWLTTYLCFGKIDRMWVPWVFIGGNELARNVLKSPVLDILFYNSASDFSEFCSDWFKYFLVSIRPVCFSFNDSESFISVSLGWSYIMKSHIPFWYPFVGFILKWVDISRGVIEEYFILRKSLALAVKRRDELDVGERTTFAIPINHTNWLKVSSTVVS